MIIACPGAGGSGAVAFAELARCLPEGQTLWVVEPRGLDGRSPPFATVEEQAAAKISSDRNWEVRGPFANPPIEVSADYDEVRDALFRALEVRNAHIAARL